MRRLAQALDDVRSTRAKTRKVERLAQLWRTLADDELEFGARLVLGQVLPGRALGVGWAIACAAAAKVSGRSERAIGLRSRELGDFGDALAEALPADRSLALREVPPLLEQLAATEAREGKLALLEALLGRCSGAEARYLGRALLGELRIGVQRGLFEESLAKAFDADLDQVRRAAAFTTDAGALALLARRHALGNAALTPGEAVAFMLATPVEQVKSPIEPAMTVFEDKLDGVRTQAHVVGGRVRLFARGLDEVTASFPDVALTLQDLGRDVVLDGEIIAVSPDGRPRPFQALQPRLGAKKRALPVPVWFVAYDCLYDGRALLDLPWSERRAHLDALPLPHRNPFSRFVADVPLEHQLDEAFTAARARGHEGLMLKRVDSVYEAGSRGAAWRKVKRAFATLDVVITRAERGHGKRAGVLSDYTFAVWAGRDLKEIGKAYSGLTDQELAALSRRLDALTVRREGPLHFVEPRLVLEVAFDGLQRSARHSSGFALRFPRIARLRDDKHAADADQLETVEALWRAQVDSGHREEPQPRQQLSLFG